MLRRTFIALAAMAALAGCGGEPEQASAPAAPALRADVAAPSVVGEWVMPVLQPGSASADLSSTPDGRLLMSWINSQRGRRHILQFSSYDPGLQRWMHAPTTIAVGNSMFVNWADTPHIVSANDGALWAHWLQKNAEAPYAYDVVLSRSRDGGSNWSPPQIPYDDRSETEHGFVSMWPQGDSGIGMAWLDGRNTKPAATSRPTGDTAQGDHAAHAGAMTLRATVLDGQLQRSGDAELDAMTCDCCQTDVAATAQGALLVYRGRTQDEIRDILVTRFDGKAWTPPLRVHADDWKMPACPVNGPAIAAQGDAAVVAWYTVAGDTPLVRIALSRDAGASFAPPVELDRGEAVQGRVDVALDSQQAWILWVRESDGQQSLWLSRRSLDLAQEYERIELAQLKGTGRGTGFPKLAVHGGIAHVLFTDVVDGVAGLRGLRVLPATQ
ncbi:sialidase family protein [Luteimonas sp. RIT-PG2_3]